MGAAMTTVASLPRHRLAQLGAAAVLASLLSMKQQQLAAAALRQSKKIQADKLAAEGGSKNKGTRGRTRKIKVNAALFVVIQKILKEGPGGREALNAAALAGTLLTRTALSLWIARNMGKSIEHFCKQDWPKVAASIRDFGVSTIAAAAVNALLKFFTSLLAMNLRAKLTASAQQLLMERRNYYCANHVGDDKFENSDQLICEDIAKFSDAAADVFSQSLKPVVDFALFSWQMGSMMGVEGPFGMYSWFLVAVAISARVLPPYGKLAAKEQELEGRFRARHAKLIQNAEMVAFMRGEKPEITVLASAYRRIRDHTLRVGRTKFVADLIQGYVNKYFASVVGFTLTARPVLINRNGMGSWSPGEIASYYVQSRQIMENLANAVLALFELQKRIGTLAGLAARVASLFDGLHVRAPLLRAQIEAAARTNPAVVIEDAETLRFEHVDVYKPDGVLLLRDLNLVVRPGDRVIITGKLTRTL